MFLVFSFSYLSQVSSNLLDYELLEKMNQATSKNVENLKSMTDDVVVANDELNTKYNELEPLMKELKDIEATVNKLESAAYKLDSFTQKLEEKINAHIQKNKSS